LLTIIIKCSKWALVAITTLAALTLGAFMYLSTSLPDVSSLRAYKLSVPLRIYTAQKDLIGVFGSKKRIPITYNQIPQHFIHAILAAEDARFASHRGVDIQSSIRAILQVFEGGGRRQTGASTITMQVARNYFLNSERTMYRKINEVLLALQIEKQLSKAEILELYTNKVYLGIGAYGLAAAAKIYYNQDIKELNIAQLAMLAGLPKAPSRYNPVVNPSRALIRRNWILVRMLSLGSINKEQYHTAITQAVVAQDHSIKTSFDARYVAEMVRLQLLQNKEFNANIYTNGYKVYTTLNSNLQRFANQAIRSGLLHYDRRRGYRKTTKVHNIFNDAGELLTEAGEILADAGEILTETDEILAETDKILADAGEILAEKDKILAKEEISILLEGKKTVSHIYPAIISHIDTEQLTIDAVLSNNQLITINTQGMQRAVKAYPADSKLTDIFTLGQELRVEKVVTGASGANDTDLITWKITQLPQAQAAIVTVNPSNGAILALSGGFSFDASQFNRATQAYRQLGSGFKPFIYGAALAKGYTAASIVNDSPIAVDHTDKVWLPENDNLKFYGPIRLRRALYQSRNMISIRLLRALSIGHVRAFAQNFGFEKARMPNDLSLSLGTIETTPLQAAIAYSTIANGGYKVDSFIIDHITNHQGEIIYQAKPKAICSLSCVEGLNASRVIDEKANYILADILKDVVRKGTARKARALKRDDIAGKTGTTNEQIDAWFNGFNGELATSVWVGFDQPKSLKEYGSQAALPIWIDFMRQALEGKPSNFLAQPDGIVSATIDKKTGALTSKGKKGAITEIFQSSKHLPQQEYSQPQPLYTPEDFSQQPSKKLDTNTDTEFLF
jgi:penicillin-binding protein 1A